MPTPKKAVTKAAAKKVDNKKAKAPKTTATKAVDPAEAPAKACSYRHPGSL